LKYGQLRYYDEIRNEYRRQEEEERVPHEHEEDDKVAKERVPSPRKRTSP